MKNINSTLQKLSENKKIYKNNQTKSNRYKRLPNGLLTYFNCLRVSNSMNITLHDINKIRKHEEIGDAYVLVNEEYKVSIIYGAKIILLDNILYQQMKQYIETYRPLVIEESKLHDMKGYVFTSSRFTTTKPLGEKMDYSMISNAMTFSFRKANVLKDDTSSNTSRVSCSRIRMSILAEIVSLEKENISTMASCFAKQ